MTGKRNECMTQTSNKIQDELCGMLSVRIKLNSQYQCLMLNAWCLMLNAWCLILNAQSSMLNAEASTKDPSNGKLKRSACIRRVRIVLRYVHRTSEFGALESAGSYFTGSSVGNDHLSHGEMAKIDWLSLILSDRRSLFTVRRSPFTALFIVHKRSHVWELDHDARNSHTVHTLQTVYCTRYNATGVGAATEIYRWDGWDPDRRRVRDRERDRGRKMLPLLLFNS